MENKQPPAPQCLTVEGTGGEIDWLEHLIETYGTVVPKHPDVWGEARLTAHRQEFETEIYKRFNTAEFQATLQGALRRSDQAALAMAFSLNAAANGSKQPTSNAASSLIVASPPQITRTNPGELNLADFQGGGQISVEPDVFNDQLARYLSHLNEIRRDNEGDDTADSPGYSLNLIRIPVSVLPGHHTRKGYGAEITFTATPYLSDDLLPSTMEQLIINDVTEMNSLPLAVLFGQPEWIKFQRVYWQYRASNEVDLQIRAMAAIARRSLCDQPEPAPIQQHSILM